jgi:hypothetical protein
MTYQNRQHEQAVKQFLQNKGLTETKLSYPHSNIYSQANALAKQDAVTSKDRKILNKFCRNWTVVKGDVTDKRLARVNKIIKYYANISYNQTMRQQRLQKKSAN